MPPHRMHLTTLEITHSRTPAEIDQIVSQMRPTIPALANFTLAHRSRLVRPMVSYDLAAFAVSFLPAAGEPVASPVPDSGAAHEGVDDKYTYHHREYLLTVHLLLSGVTLYCLVSTWLLTR